MKEDNLISTLFQTEYRKIISVLFKKFGLIHLEIAEDITHDTFLLASELWSVRGIPENPKAWLYTVARNKTRDYLKRDKIFSDKIVTNLKNAPSEVAEPGLDLSVDNIKDSQLRMMFVVCNDVLSKEAQISLTLRILCGLGIEEIAEAFLTNKETINKRLFRAKEKLRKEDFKIELPGETVISQRIESVLTTIYLLFNEGYYSSTQNKTLRKELCLEAMRLNYLLLENEKTDLPKVNALLSLMCFHSSRFESRIDSEESLVLYAEQNRNNWNYDLISKGTFYLNKSAEGKEITKYHLEAGIAFWHTREDREPGKWDNILQLYNQLLQIDYSPIAALNRTYALSKTNGKKEALQEALKIGLENNHLYHSLLGELYKGLDQNKQIEHLEIAVGLAKTRNDKSIILQKLETIRNGKCE